MHTSPRSVTADARSPVRQTEAATASWLVHGTVVEWLGRGVLLKGPSGVGKSDLALRLIEAGAVLVADDLVRLELANNRISARAAGDRGLIELRGQGIFRLPSSAATALDVCVELAALPASAERLPTVRWSELDGVRLPCYRLDPRTASATARLRVLLSAERKW